MNIFQIRSKNWWNFLLALVEREIRSKYKFTKLGFYWMLLSPVFQMLIIGFVFQFFMPLKIDDYFIYLYIGLVVWNYFSSTISRNTRVIIDEKPLIQKSNFPREVLVISNTLTNSVGLIISLVILMLMMLFLNTGHCEMWVGLPLALLVLIIVTLGFSFLLSTINVRHRDIEFAVSAILPLWFYGTPILYNLEMLPKEISWLFYLNPITFIMDIFRYFILGIPIYSLSGCVSGLVFVLVMALFGYWLFMRRQLDFNDWI